MAGRDRGVALIWFAAAATVLIGMGALVVDYGALLWERRQLQNGADAAVLAAAADCAVANCVGASDSAQSYANANARDGISDVQICGQGPGLTASQACASVPAEVGTANFVQARTSTRTSEGTQIKFVLAPVLDAANIGQTVSASATAVWGTVGAANVKAFALPTCLVPTNISDPSYVPAVGTVYIKSSGGGGKVVANCPGTALPAAFDFAVPDPGGDGCSVKVEIVSQPDGSSYGLVEKRTQGFIPECKASMLSSANLNDTILLPVAVNMVTINKVDYYKIDGFVSIEVCGFDLGQGKDGNPDFLYDQCGPGHCSSLVVDKDYRICGTLRRIAMTDAKLGTGKNYGTYVIKMVK